MIFVSSTVTKSLKIGPTILHEFADFAANHISKLWRFTSHFLYGFMSPLTLLAPVPSSSFGDEFDRHLSVTFVCFYGYGSTWSRSSSLTSLDDSGRRSNSLRRPCTCSPLLLIYPQVSLTVDRFPVKCTSFGLGHFCRLLNPFSVLAKFPCNFRSQSMHGTKWVMVKSFSKL